MTQMVIKKSNIIRADIKKSHLVLPSELFGKKLKSLCIKDSEVNNCLFDNLSDEMEEIRLENISAENYHIIFGQFLECLQKQKRLLRFDFIPY